MQTLEEIVDFLAPALAATYPNPVWACAYRSAPEPGEDPPPARFDLWAGGEPFVDWYPPDYPDAIAACLPLGQPGGLRPGHGVGPPGSAPSPCSVVCVVSDEGDAFGALLLPSGQHLGGTPLAGELLDLVRSKLGLPCGPPSAYALEMHAGPS